MYWEFCFKSKSLLRRKNEWNLKDLKEKCLVIT